MHLLVGVGQALATVFIVMCIFNYAHNRQICGQRNRTLILPINVQLTSSPTSDIQNGVPYHLATNRPQHIPEKHVQVSLSYAFR